MKKTSKYSICLYCNLCVYSLIVILLVSSCANPIEKESIIGVKHFPQIISLKGKSINDIRNDFYPLQMGLFKDNLIFCDWENSPHFHVYNLPNFEYVGNFGRQGRGPGEYLDPVFWGQFQQNDSIGIWIFQMNTHVFSLINIEQSLYNKNYQPQKQFTLPAETQAAVNVIALRDDTILGSGISSEGEFFFFYPNKESLEWKEFRIDYSKSVNSFFKNNFNDISLLKQGVTKIKPDQTRFVKSMIYVPIIDVYFPNGDIDFSIILKDFAVPSFRNGEFNPSTSVWYENVFLTDNYIYALNRNCNILQYTEGDCNDVEIHVFSWQGEPVKKYLLKEGIAPSAPFVFDEQNQKIYTVNYKDSEDFLYVYDLNISN